MKSHCRSSSANLGTRFASVKTKPRRCTGERAPCRKQAMPNSTKTRALAAMASRGKRTAKTYFRF